MHGKCGRDNGDNPLLFTHDLSSGSFFPKHGKRGGFLFVSARSQDAAGEFDNHDQ